MSSKPVLDSSPQSRIARYDEYFDQRTFSWTLRKTTKPKKQRNKNHVLLVRRVMNHKGQHAYTITDIKSTPLVEVLQEINEGVPNLSLGQDPPTADPKLFFHSYAGLEKRLEEERLKTRGDEALISDLEVALDFTLEDHASAFANMKSLESRGEISFDLLWALFRPNILVYRRDLLEQDQVLQFQIIEDRERPRTKLRYAKLTCHVIKRGTGMLGVSSEVIEIDFFPGTKKITDLPLYPLLYHPKANAIREHAISRGRRFASMEGNVYKEVHGAAVRMSDEKTKETDDGEKVHYEVKFTAHGRAMIDPAAFQTFEPNNILNPLISKYFEKDALTEEQYMICTPVVLGFCFGNKIWGGFAMDRLEDVVWSEEPFNSLAIGQKQKDLIYSLLKQHDTRLGLFDDVIRGKGKGLIGLLSGRPGCGKTLTAEATAELTHRPLYAVSAGELGTQPVEVDKHLRKILALAQTWNAVLLLDEVEVFLQKRSTTDVARNALVSIFLRELEYYQGILILTTNLPGQIDPAFESRIHFCVNYPDLNLDSRRRIWKTFFDRTGKQITTNVTEKDLDKLARHELNGRQIKNAVATAQSIALEENSPLLVKHIDVVLDVLSEWNVARTRTETEIEMVQTRPRIPKTELRFESSLEQQQVRIPVRYLYVVLSVAAVIIVILMGRKSRCVGSIL